jgi:hypothetical protein
MNTGEAPRHLRAGRQRSVMSMELARATTHTLTPERAQEGEEAKHRCGTGMCCLKNGPSHVQQFYVLGDTMQ